jgi:membrane-associated phospholipid phosphatase
MRATVNSFARVPIDSSFDANMSSGQARSARVHRFGIFCRAVGPVLLAVFGGCSASVPHLGVHADSDTRAAAFSLQFTAADENTQDTPSLRPPAAKTIREVSANVATQLPTEPVQTQESPLPDHVSSEPEAFTFHDDLRALGPGLAGDLRALANWETVGILAAGGAASLAVRETVDDDVDDWTLESLHRWGNADEVLAALGNPAHHFAAAGVLWGTSLATQDPELHDLSGAMTSALILTNASTLLLKIAANSDAPNGEAHGWPSGHTSSSFTMAAVLDEFYGPWIGVPAYGLAGLVAFSRIDDREHDLSDVIFGAALGYGIGKVVAARHHCESNGITLLPYLEPVEGTTGVALEKRY